MPTAFDLDSAAQEARAEQDKVYARLCETERLSATVVARSFTLNWLVQNHLDAVPANLETPVFTAGRLHGLTLAKYRLQTLFTQLKDRQQYAGIHRIRADTFNSLSRPWRPMLHREGVAREAAIDAAQLARPTGRIRPNEIDDAD